MNKIQFGLYVMSAIVGFSATVSVVHENIYARILNTLTAIVGTWILRGQWDSYTSRERSDLD